MVADLPSAWTAFTQLAHQAGSWLWCWEFDLDVSVTATTRVAIVNNPTAVTVDGVAFNPFPITQSELEQNSEGDLPQMEIQMDNTSRLLGAYVDQGGGFLDRNVALRIANSADFSVFYRIDFKVVGCSLTTKAASIRLEIDNWFLRKVPMDVYHAYRCRHLFGSTRCGYLISALGAYTTCDRHITDCIARGLDMKARNLGSRQPEAFGAFLGVPLT